MAVPLNEKDFMLLYNTGANGYIVTAVQTCYQMLKSDGSSRGEVLTQNVGDHVSSTRKDGVSWNWRSFSL